MKAIKINSNHLYFLTRLFILLVLLLTVVNITRIFENRKVLGVTVDNSSVIAQKEYYLKLIKDNPTYVDGYVELSNIEKFLGNTESANQYLKLAQNLDPNRSFK